MIELPDSGPWKRIERIGNAVLLLGDCLEILPHLPKVDAIVTDPPYGMGFRSNYRAIRYDFIEGDRVLPLQAIQTLIALPERFSYVFCRWDNLKDMPPPKSVLTWIKNNWSMGDLKHEHGRQWEAICFYPCASHQFITRVSDVINADRTGNDEHPTQKPIYLMEHLIRANVCSEVLDPFMGSGTTGVACMNLGRKFIGIEICEKYYNIAVERITNAQRQQPLFDHAQANHPRPDQMSMLPEGN